MNYSVLNVGPNAHLDVPVEHPVQPSADHLTVLLCASGSTATVPFGFAGLWWCVRGEALALSSDSRVALNRRTIFVSDSQRNHSVCVQTSSNAIGLIASQTFWSALISLLGEEDYGEPAVFPAVHSASAKICKQLLQFLRWVMGTSSDGLDASQAIRLALTVRELQQSFTSLIARCPGPSLSRRRTVFLRLQRVRNHLSHCTQQKVDVGKLALTTNYSVSSFIRVYYSVFGETPYSYISRRRIDRAKKLLEAGEQCVGDVALAVGFEHGSSLTRAIKRRYGRSATEFRRAKDRSDVRAEEELL